MALATSFTTPSHKVSEELKDICYGWVTLIKGDESYASSVSLVEREYVFGRAPDAQFHISVSNVSRIHCRLYIDEDKRVWIENLSRRGKLMKGMDHIEYGSRREDFHEVNRHDCITIEGKRRYLIRLRPTHERVYPPERMKTPSPISGRNALYQNPANFLDTDYEYDSDCGELSRRQRPAKKEASPTPSCDELSPSPLSSASTTPPKSVRFRRGQLQKQDTASKIVSTSSSALAPPPSDLQSHNALESALKSKAKSGSKKSVSFAWYNTEAQIRGTPQSREREETAVRRMVTPSSKKMPKRMHERIARNNEAFVAASVARDWEPKRVSADALAQESEDSSQETGSCVLSAALKIRNRIKTPFREGGKKKMLFTPTSRKQRTDETADSESMRPLTVERVQLQMSAAKSRGKGKEKDAASAVASATTQTVDASDFGEEQTDDDAEELEFGLAGVPLLVRQRLAVGGLAPASSLASFTRGASHFTRDNALGQRTGKLLRIDTPRPFGLTEMANGAIVGQKPSVFKHATYNPATGKMEAMQSTTQSTTTGASATVAKLKKTPLVASSTRNVDRLLLSIKTIRQSSKLGKLNDRQKHSLNEMYKATVRVRVQCTGAAAARIVAEETEAQKTKAKSGGMRGRKLMEDEKEAMAGGSVMERITEEVEEEEEAVGSGVLGDTKIVIERLQSILDDPTMDDEQLLIVQPILDTLDDIPLLGDADADAFTAVRSESENGTIKHGGSYYSVEEESASSSGVQDFDGDSQMTAKKAKAKGKSKSGDGADAGKCVSLLDAIKCTAKKSRPLPSSASKRALQMISANFERSAAAVLPQSLLRRGRLNTRSVFMALATPAPFGDGKAKSRLNADGSKTTAAVPMNDEKQCEEIEAECREMFLQLAASLNVAPSEVAKVAAHKLYKGVSQLSQEIEQLNDGLDTTRVRDEAEGGDVQMTASTSRSPFGGGMFSSRSFQSDDEESEARKELVPVLQLHKVFGTVLEQKSDATVSATMHRSSGKPVDSSSNECRLAQSLFEGLDALYRKPVALAKLSPFKRNTALTCLQEMVAATPEKLTEVLKTTPAASAMKAKTEMTVLDGVCQLVKTPAHLSKRKVFRANATSVSGAPFTRFSPKTTKTTTTTSISDKMAAATGDLDTGTGFVFGSLMHSCSEDSKQTPPEEASNLSKKLQSSPGGFCLFPSKTSRKRDSVEVCAMNENMDAKSEDPFAGATSVFAAMQEDDDVEDEGASFVKPSPLPQMIAAANGTGAGASQVKLKLTDAALKAKDSASVGYIHSDSVSGGISTQASVSSRKSSFGGSTVPGELPFNPLDISYGSESGLCPEYMPTIDLQTELNFGEKTGALSQLVQRTQHGHSGSGDEDTDYVNDDMLFGDAENFLCYDEAADGSTVPLEHDYDDEEEEAGDCDEDEDMERMGVIPKSVFDEAMSKDRDSDGVDAGKGQPAESGEETGKQSAAESQSRLRLNVVAVAATQPLPASKVAQTKLESRKTGGSAQRAFKGAPPDLTHSLSQPQGDEEFASTLTVRSAISAIACGSDETERISDVSSPTADGSMSPLFESPEVTRTLSDILATEVRVGKLLKTAPRTTGRRMRMLLSRHRQDLNQHMSNVFIRPNSPRKARRVPMTAQLPNRGRRRLQPPTGSEHMIHGKAVARRSVGARINNRPSTTQIRRSMSERRPSALELKRMKSLRTDRSAAVAASSSDESPERCIAINLDDSGFDEVFAIPFSVSKDENGKESMSVEMPQSSGLDKAPATGCGVDGSSEVTLEMPDFGAASFEFSSAEASASFVKSVIEENSKSSGPLLGLESVMEENEMEAENGCSFLAHDISGLSEFGAAKRCSEKRSITTLPPLSDDCDEVMATATMSRNLTDEMDALHSGAEDCEMAEATSTTSAMLSSPIGEGAHVSTPPMEGVTIHDWGTVDDDAECGKLLTEAVIVEEQLEIGDEFLEVPVTGCFKDGVRMADEKDDIDEGIVALKCKFVDFGEGDDDEEEEYESGNGTPKKPLPTKLLSDSGVAAEGMRRLSIDGPQTADGSEEKSQQLQSIHGSISTLCAFGRSESEASPEPITDSTNNLSAIAEDTADVEVEENCGQLTETATTKEVAEVRGAEDVFCGEQSAVAKVLEETSDANVDGGGDTEMVAIGTDSTSAKHLEVTGVCADESVDAVTAEDCHTVAFRKRARSERKMSSLAALSQSATHKTQRRRRPKRKLSEASSDDVEKDSAMQSVVSSTSSRKKSKTVSGETPAEMKLPTFAWVSPDSSELSTATAQRKGAPLSPLSATRSKEVAVGSVPKTPEMERNVSRESSTASSSSSQSSAIESPLKIAGVELKKYRVVDLRKKLKKRGLSTTGRKWELVQRLEAHLRAEKKKKSATTKSRAKATHRTKTKETQSTATKSLRRSARIRKRQRRC